MKKLLNILFGVAVLVCFSSCGTSPVGIETVDSPGGMLYRNPVPKPDCKIVNCKPPPKPE